MVHELVVNQRSSWTERGGGLQSIYIGSNPILPSIYTFLEMILHKTILNLCDSETSKKLSLI